MFKNTLQNTRGAYFISRNNFVLRFNRYLLYLILGLLVCRSCVREPGPPTKCYDPDIDHDVYTHLMEVVADVLSGIHIQVYHSIVMCATDEK